MASEIQGVAPDRLVPAALMPMLDVDDAVAELQHAAEIGLHLVSLPTGNPPGTAGLERRRRGSRCGPRPRRPGW